ncbi:hypothetical protein ACSSWA_14540 [Melioribacter sp. Ez-97]|uniref:hypothetical protein n=1 Tax=Melioribacter sp. Ez-97 TaxID=3423434 RepID=UPI003ED9F153
MEKQNNKKLFFIVLLLLFGLLGITLRAQDSGDEFRSKLKKLKGEVERITVETDDGKVVFEGDEAQMLADRIRLMGMIPPKIKINIDPDEFEWEGIDEFDFDFAPDIDIDLPGRMMFWYSDDSPEAETDKDVKIEIKDGVKKVTVTTKKDGKESTKVYEGDEAEEFLKENMQKKFRIKLGEPPFTGRCDCCCCRHREHIVPTPQKIHKKIIIEKERKEKE